MEQLGDLLVGVAVAEHRQRKGCFGDEHVAGDEFERRAGRVGNVLVVARGDDTQAVRLDQDLGRTEHMAGRVERDFRAAEAHAFAVADRLDRPGKVFAVAQPHEIERLLRRQHRAMAGARMVGMAVRDQRPFDRPGRVDVEVAELAAYARGRKRENVFSTHRCQICCSLMSRTLGAVREAGRRLAQPLVHSLRYLLRRWLWIPGSRCARTGMTQ